MDDGQGGGRCGRPLIGAPAGTVSMCENVTAAHMAVLSTLPPPATRDAIVCSAADFPSMIYLFRAQEALGYRLVIVPANDDGSADPRASPTPSTIAPRWSPSRTCCSARRSSWTRRRSSSAPGASARRSCSTSYQAAGIIPVDVTALGVDFAAGGV